MTTHAPVGSRCSFCRQLSVFLHRDWLDFLGKAISSRFGATLPLSQKYRDWVNFVSVFFFLWIAPIFEIFTKSSVPVRRVAWFSVSCWIAYLLEPQLYRNFRILGVTDFFWLFVAPKKDLTPTEVF
jgi:hypothetical protein